VLGFLSSCPNWDPPTPSPTGECVPPPFVPGWGEGDAFSLVGEGVGDPNSDEGTVWKLQLYVLCGFLHSVLLLSTRGKSTVHCNTNIRRVTALSSSLYLYCSSAKSPSVCPAGNRTGDFYSCGKQACSPFSYVTP
jgi:hypothetical protein